MIDNINNILTHERINKGYSYESYRNMIEELMRHGKTTGQNQSELLTKYTALNITRMERIDKTFVMTDELRNSLNKINDKWIWVVLTEAWCGDAAQIVPAIAAIARNSDNIILRLLLRDKNPDIMNKYLTNGTRSIPKLICLKENKLKELGTWGPRPKDAQEILIKYKSADIWEPDKFKEQLHKWYNDNKTISIQSELSVCIMAWLDKFKSN